MAFALALITLAIISLKTLVKVLLISLIAKLIT